MADRSGSPPDMPPEALEAITAPRAPDAPRRCFICLTDEDPSDPPNLWVDPCPCTLEAHQDCMLSWVTDCERSQKPLRCPVCKSNIEMEGPWDPIISLTDAVQRRFTRVSPFMLFTGVSLGIQFSSQMYGSVALWMFAGRDSLMQFMFGPDMIIDGRASHGLKFSRVSNAAILMNVAPALLVSQLLPSLGNKIFVPTASLYGIYHVMHDDHFVSWPPSPQLAIAVFPYIRSIYYNLWREFVFPYERDLNRQILGLPPDDGTPGTNREQRRNAVRENGEGGIIGFLQGILDALEPDDEENRAAGGGRNFQVVQDDAQPEGGNNQDNEVVVDVELIIEQEQEAEGDAAPEDAPGEAGENGEEHEQGEREEPQAEVEAPAQAVPRGPPGVPDRPQPPAPAPRENQEAQDNHVAPPAPPANRVGLGALLSNFSNTLVSALILPGVSFAVGEALRLALPSSWTASQPRYFFKQRPGLLQQQWGRSLIGGCLFVVIKDVIRFYAKHRKVAAMGNRRVRNVDRPRRRGNNRQQ